MWRTFAVFCCVAFLFASPVRAYVSPGNPQGYVNDFAGVMSVNVKDSLEQQLSLFTASTSNEISVAIVPTLQDDYIENYSIKLFEDWKIGTRVHDNGVLLLLAIAEHKVHIEVGYGLEGALSDSVAANIIAGMRDDLQAKKYDDAITHAAFRIMEATQNEYTSEKGNYSGAPLDPRFIIFGGVLIIQWLGAILGRTKSWWLGGVVGAIAGTATAYFLAWTIIFGAFITLILAIIGCIFDYFVSSSYSNYAIGGGTPPWFIGGGGGGFGGFGGGRSGGGGASGGW